MSEKFALVVVHLEDSPAMCMFVEQELATVCEITDCQFVYSSTKNPIEVPSLITRATRNRDGHILVFIGDLDLREGDVLSMGGEPAIVTVRRNYRHAHVIIFSASGEERLTAARDLVMSVREHEVGDGVVESISKGCSDQMVSTVRMLLVTGRNRSKATPKTEGEV